MLADQGLASPLWLALAFLIVTRGDELALSKDASITTNTDFS